MKISLTVISLFIVTQLYVAFGAESSMTIDQATKYCEAEVPKYCTATTCPQFCGAIRSPKAKKACPAQCTNNNRCKLKPHVGTDSSNNMALDAQNRAQLWSCIAQKRGAIKTGAPETPWKEFRTPSFQQAIRP